MGYQHQVGKHRTSMLGEKETSVPTPFSIIPCKLFLP